MGLADRDYMRVPTQRTKNRSRGGFAAAIAVAAVLAVVALPLRSHLPGLQHGRRVMTIKPLGVGPGVTVGRPYPMNDRWANYLPPSNRCAASRDKPSDAHAAEQAMLCALNYARRRAGLTVLSSSPQLHTAARLKALDIIRCQQFSHAACGRDPHAVADAAGYPKVTWGENIYAGSGPFMPARVAADGWLNSPHHRENLFRPQWTEQGVAVVVAKQFKGERDVAIWVSEFGERR